VGGGCAKVLEVPVNGGDEVAAVEACLRFAYVETLPPGGGGIFDGGLIL
jgi:hypothetical protein